MRVRTCVRVYDNDDDDDEIILGIIALVAVNCVGLKKPFTLRSRTIKDAQDRPIDDTDEIRETCIVVDPVPAILPAEVTKTIRHINNNKAPGSDDLNI